MQVIVGQPVTVPSETTGPTRGMIYIFGGAHDHGLSRGNAIFETRRSRKAIIPKAVLIKAQPRYIVAMPHTPPVRPLCTLPSRPIVHSSTLPSLPPVSLFHGHPPYRTPPHTSPILYVDARIFSRDSLSLVPVPRVGPRYFTRASFRYF